MNRKRTTVRDVAFLCILILPLLTYILGYAAFRLQWGQEVSLGSGSSISGSITLIQPGFRLPASDWQTLFKPCVWAEQKMTGRPIVIFPSPIDAIFLEQKGYVRPNPPGSCR